MSVEQGLTYNISIVGDPADADPTSRFYFGVWQVTVKSSPKSPSIALAFLKDHLDIPHLAAQSFIVRDTEGRVQQNICETTADPGSCANIQRISHQPVLGNWGQV